MKKFPLHPAVVLAPIGVVLCIDIAGAVLGVPPFPDLFLYTLPARIGWMTLQAIFVYQLWRLAQASDLKAKKLSPGKAIAFWYIPFFGLYWIFVMLRLLALHLNHLTSRNKVPVRLVTIACGLLVAGLFTPLVSVTPTGKSVVVILDLSNVISTAVMLVNNFYFYGAAREICGVAK